MMTPMRTLVAVVVAAGSLALVVAVGSLALVAAAGSRALVEAAGSLALVAAAPEAAAPCQAPAPQPLAEQALMAFVIGENPEEPALILKWAPGVTRWTAYDAALKNLLPTASEAAALEALEI